MPFNIIIQYIVSKNTKRCKYIKKIGLKMFFKTF